MTDINIEVAFMGYLKQYTGHKEPQRLAMPVGSLAKDVVTHYQVPERLVKLVHINGEKAALDSPLQDGDAIILQPVLLGG